MVAVAPVAACGGGGVGPAAAWVAAWVACVGGVGGGGVGGGGVGGGGVRWRWWRGRRRRVACTPVLMVRPLDLVEPRATFYSECGKVTDLRGIDRRGRGSRVRARLKLYPTRPRNLIEYVRLDPTIARSNVNVANPPGA